MSFMGGVRCDIRDYCYPRSSQGPARRCIIRVHAAIVCWCPSRRGTAWAHTADQVAPFRRQVALGGLFGAQRVETILRAIERWG